MTEKDKQEQKQAIKKILEMKKRKIIVKCPCCGKFEFDILNHPDMNVCEVCYWERDTLQDEDLDYDGGANWVSLNEARANYKKYGEIMTEKNIQEYEEFYDNLNEEIEERRKEEKKMEKLELKKIAEETLQIIKNGYYRVNGKVINLPDLDYTETIVYNKKTLEAIQNERVFFENYAVQDDSCSMYLIDADSFLAAESLERPLVMNFANAKYPGGGFLNGARAQEESLCRESTLYASLSSKAASEMYSYNKAHRNPVYSDYMLLTPNVCVFRDFEGNLLEEPYVVSVFTIPAPNKNGAAKNEKQSKLDYVMKNRIRKFFLAAASENYKTLILGAWGCGAFGHDARRVAGYFKEILINENYKRFFETIVFSILDGDDQKKLQAFSEVFGDEIEVCVDLYYLGDAEIAEKMYYEANKPMPVCNHSCNDLDSNNIGFTQGVMEDGTPFEAEMWRDGDDISVTVYMPEKDEFSQIDKPEKTENEQIVGFHYKVESNWNAALSVGMVIREYEAELSETQAYVYYLRDMGIFKFASNTYNGYIHFLTDIEGNDLVGINICLSRGNKVEATTKLTFKSFPMQPPTKPNLTLIQ